MVTGGLKSGHCVILIAFKRCTLRRLTWGKEATGTKSEVSGHVESPSLAGWWGVHVAEGDSHSHG